MSRFSVQARMLQRQGMNEDELGRKEEKVDAIET